MKHKDNLESTGDWAKQTWRTTSPNIMHLPTMFTRVKDLEEARSQRAKQGKTKPTYQGNASYKGVLNLRYERTYGKPTIG
jgi:hypothetical protein